MIRALFAAGTALLISFLFNRWFKNKLMLRVAHLIIPFEEEVFKTLSALNLLAPIPLTHFIFGCGESIFEYTQKPGMTWLVGLADILSHTLFGFITYWIYIRFNSVIAGIAFAGVVHYAWNFLIYKYSSH